MNLVETNNFITEQFEYFDFKEELSRPLLVTTDNNYKENVKNKVLYIGQETNGWGSHKMEFDDIEEERKYIERIYYNMFYQRNGTKSLFWKFIENTLEINKTDLKNNIIWANAYIAGNATKKGLSNHSKEIKDISINYLTHLYDYFKPTKTIIVSGPKDPYYDNISAFLSNIGKSLEKPNKESLIKCRDDIIYTYHPNYLRLSKNESSVKEEVKKFIKR